MSELLKYGSALSPLGNLVVPGAGNVLKDALNAARGQLDRKETLHEQRQKLIALLKAFPLPIVVMIDEVDRVDDDEIKVVAQLVRSIADFPGISYVLAYDSDRVIEALSGDDVTKSRGRAYLEKIVQLQIPLPITLDTEIHRLLEAELEPLVGVGLVPPNRRAIERYDSLLKVLVPAIIGTPRDVKRLTGAFRPLASMVGNEVDWIDLLGFCALLGKAPLTIESIKRNPDAVVEDSTSLAELVERASSEKKKPEERLKSMNAEGESSVAPLLGFLFPRLSTKRHPFRNEEPTPDSIRYIRPLLTALRLDLLPGIYSRDEIIALFGKTETEIAEFLRRAYDEDRIGNLLVRIGDLAPHVAKIDQKSFWNASAIMLRKPNCDWLDSYSPMHEIVRAFADLFTKILTKPQLHVARMTFRDLLSQNEIEITSQLLRSQIFAHGLYGQSSSQSVVFLEKTEADAIAREISGKYRGQFLNGPFIPCLWSLQPVYTMVDTGNWDEACRQKLSAELSEDVHAVDGLALMLYGAHFSTGRDFVEKLVDRTLLVQQASERLASSHVAAPHESTRIALMKVIDPIV